MILQPEVTPLAFCTDLKKRDTACQLVSFRGADRQILLPLNKIHNPSSACSHCGDYFLAVIYQKK